MKTLMTWSAACCMALALMTFGGRALAADAAKLDGKWKLVLLPFGEDEFAVVSIETKDGKLAAEVVDAQVQVLGKVTIKSIERAGDTVTLVISGQVGIDTFKGTLAAEGKEKGRLLGTHTFRGQTFPARLEKTEADKVATLMPSPLQQKLGSAMSEANPKAKIAKLEELIKDFPGPRLSQVYPLIIQSAEAADLSDKEVGAYLKTWFADAKPYGPSWEADCRASALRALQGKKAFAALSLTLAQDAEKALAKDATLEQQATALGALASAAKLSGKADLAEATTARLAKIESKLDDEYHEKVPPFQPETYAGREKSDKNRVVLMELFTGAQCPPCVAADVGFDALLKTYKTTDLVTLQYHLHIPGPDPLTNEDSEARAQFYAVRGTPATYFNGESKAGGGGGMANAKSKYDQFRKIIDEELGEERGAKIDVKATRSGDKISITASASTVDGKKGDKDASPTLRLRLALTEESIRYVGGNKLRFHHHVVRGLIGGTRGTELAGGKCEVKETVDLDDVRKGLDKYLSERSFPNALPEIAFKGLALVAFVQDDSDKRVLHVVTVPVPEAK